MSYREPQASNEPTDSVTLSGRSPAEKAPRTLAPSGFAVGLLAAVSLMGLAGAAHAAPPPQQHPVTQSQPSAAKQAGRQVREAGKQVGEVGKEIGKQGAAVGKEIGKQGAAVGKEIGRQGAEVGREIGKAGKEFGLGVRDFFKGLSGQ